MNGTVVMAERRLGSDDRRGSMTVDGAYRIFSNGDEVLRPSNASFFSPARSLHPGSSFYYARSLSVMARLATTQLRDRREPAGGDSTLPGRRALLPLLLPFSAVVHCFCLLRRYGGKLCVDG
ncbi:uncharacterized protein DS421_6g193810 [Arachis hypogaea]|nr:uncharacterized protein DS421_6g193810 [Arachis hypogaea]